MLQIWQGIHIEDFWKLGTKFSLDGVSSHSFQWRGFEENILQFSIRLVFLKFIKNNFLFRKLITKLSERKIRLSAAINKTNINFLFLFFHQNTEKAPRNYPNMQQREENVPPWKMDWNCFPSQNILNSLNFPKIFRKISLNFLKSFRVISCKTISYIWIWVYLVTQDCSQLVCINFYLECKD